MDEKFYIVASVINYTDDVATGFALYRNLKDAEEAMEREVKNISENFNMDIMELTTDMPRYKQYMDENGELGFIVSIEEVIPQ